MTGVIPMKRLNAFIMSAALAVSAEAAFAQQAFDTPEAAAAALVEATGSGDHETVYAIFGPEGREVLSSGVESVDEQSYLEFHEAANNAMTVTERSDGATIVYIGDGQWPFPVPLVKGDKGWMFDIEAARDEILHRRIGENELNVIDAMKVYVVAQREFMLMDPNGDGVMTYADSFLSSAGEKDGLYWPAEEGELQSPFGPLAAQAADEGYVVGDRPAEPTPFHGYYYRLLTSQGESAPGGAMDYYVNGHMVAGFAALAYPAAYGESGVMSFIVGPAGVIYEKDLGEDTLAAAAAIESFDPGEGWEPLAEE